MASVTLLGGASRAGAAEAGASFHRVVLPPESPRPIRTAARELAAHTGAPVVELPVGSPLAAGDLVLVLGEALRSHGGAWSRLGDPVPREWELVLPEGGGLLIAGSSPRNVVRAALGWIEAPDAETGRLSTYELQERFTMWDNTMNQMYRFSRGFNRRQHFREIARLGFTGVEINRYVGGGYHVFHRKFPNDSYAWYMSYAPALDAFVESSLTRGLYGPEELAANLQDLREAAELAREFGLKPGFVCYEPRGINEAFFDQYPNLRGSRIDHPGRSLQPRYALDIAHPRVLQHYAESLTLLMREVPELRYFNFWTQDSGSGIPFASKLYFGPNGSYLARTKTMGELVRDFTGTLVDAGRKINPEFEVLMEIGWEYTAGEKKEIDAILPKGVTYAHPLGGSLLDSKDPGYAGGFLVPDRMAGIDPYLNVIGFSGHDPEPIIAVPEPGILLRKWRHLRDTRIRRMMLAEGILSPPQSPFSVNQELFLELVRGQNPDLPKFLESLAGRWCKGDDAAAAALLTAWNDGNAALDAWPKINWYHGGVGRTQGRWLTRPLVPDITKLTERERSAWERCLFPLPWDIARQNISFEGGIRFFEDSEFAKVIAASDAQVIPRLTRAVDGLTAAMARSPHPVLEDQRDRYRGLLLCMKTDRNLFALQLATNDYLLKQGDRAAAVRRVQEAIRAEMANTDDWIKALRESRTTFFRVADKEETPFIFLTPVEDLELKRDVMPRHLDDEPGPFLQDLIEPKRRKLAFGAVA